MKPHIMLALKISNILDSIFPKSLVVRPLNTASATAIWEICPIVSVNLLKPSKMQKSRKAVTLLGNTVFLVFLLAYGLR
jgi:hypothetical protein